MSSPFPVLNNKPIDQWKVTELKEELKRRKLPLKGLKEELVRRLDESLREEMTQTQKEQEQQEQEEEVNTPPVEFKTDNNAGLEEEITEIAPEGKTETDGLVEENTEIAPEGKTKTDGLEEGITEIAPEGKTETDRLEAGNTEIAPEGKTETDGLEEWVQVEKENTEIAPEGNTEPDETLNPKFEAVEEPKTEAVLEEEKSTFVEEPKSEAVLEEEKSTEQVTEQVQVKGTGTEMKKCESISKSNTELKNDDNLNTDNFDLEKKQQQQIEVKQDEPQQDDHKNASNENENNNSNINNTNTNNNENENMSEEKLSSNDDSMEEVNYENAPEIVSPVERGENMKEEAENYENAPEETDNKMDVETSDDKAPAEKRKLEVEEETVQNDENVKRQRRWTSDPVKIPERETANLSQSNTPKDSVSPSVNKRAFNRSDSNISTDSPKERIVPPSQKEPTNSLRIDRFLRPFTLKAVQDLLAKTGTVSSFWMDHIKTHCYVTYSSIEEAIATRNALYNLKWPTNGGNQLIAEFVDPTDVKSRLEQPPAVSPHPVTATPKFSRQNSGRNNLPPPPAGMAPAMVLPPPPPLRKSDPTPAVVTLDDLFRKTKAVPRVYYLPCSEEKVAAKLAARAKAAKE